MYTVSSTRILTVLLNDLIFVPCPHIEWAQVQPDQKLYRSALAHNEIIEVDYVAEEKTAQEVLQVLKAWRLTKFLMNPLMILLRTKIEIRTHPSCQL